ncbi:MAG: LPS-assembly protein LptD [Ignavibacteriae bacterium]|nr:LPS-assembly protein LptD [Ignavibacteriota bacterium]
MIKFIYILLFLLFPLALCAQVDLQDTLGTPIDTLSPPPDTLDVTLDTLSGDTSIVTIDTSRQVQSDIDAVVNYTAKDSAVFDFKTNKLILYNEAVLIYKDLQLNSGVIILDRETEVLEGIGFQDSTREGKYVQTPIMTQGTDKYEGVRLVYNFATKTGNVSMGFTEAEQGYYYGEIIKKVNNEVYFVKNGRYTTSTNREDPEYYFLSPKMKVIPNDKVIAQNVFLYIEGVPVFWLPFAVFPNRSGRSSGIIPPTFGSDGTYGQYIANGGYFWAINDFMDINATVNIFTKGRYDFKSRFRYAQRYVMTGNIEAGYTMIRLGEDTDPDKFTSDEWAFNINHSQNITPTLSLTGNLSFVSGKSYYDNNTNNFDELLRQNVISNLTASKYWEGTPFSLNLNYYRDQNLQTGDITQRLPNLTFSVTENYPFRSPSGSSYNRNFYEDIGFSYSLNAVNSLTRTTTQTTSGTDSTYNDDKYGARHNATVKYSPKFSFISFTPSINYTEIWYPNSIRKSFNSADSSVTETTIDGFNAVRYFNAALSFNTNFVGIFTPNVFSVTGIRHTITPSITYSYSPDFSDPSFGYYGTYTDASGNDVKYSFYENGIFGSPPSGESQLLSFSMNNLFEMKTRVNDSTENKFQLINITSGLSYNFAADSLKFSEITNTFRTKIGSILDISGSANFSLYKYNDSLNSRINSFLWDDGKVADLTNFTLNLSTGFDFLFSSSQKEEKKSTTNDTLAETEKSIIVKDKYDAAYDIPVSGSISYFYNLNQSNPNNITRTSNLGFSVDFSLSKNWNFGFRTNYDLISEQLSAPYFTAYRDLNSWEMLFNWYPIGAYRGFKFEVRIKAPDLHDIKIDKQTNDRGAFSNF